MTESNFQYGLVARKKKPLAEYTLVKGNFREIAEGLIKHADPKTPYTSLDQGQFMLYTYTSDKMTFLCICKSSVDHTLATCFLREMQERWIKMYGEKCPRFGEYSKNVEFGQSEIHNLMDIYNIKGADHLGLVSDLLQEAELITIKNLSKAYERGDQLNIMDAKAQNILKGAKKFHQVAHELKNGN